ncbi:MAG: cysteine hydrolase [candidate division Zixibacteria bacterium]|nr:cysteine hydrolase [candidate division Zixibacteria bacterium]
MRCYINQENLKEKTKIWLRKISPYNIHRLELNLRKAALLVIDMQNFFLEPQSHSFICAGVTVLPNVKKLVNFFRQRKRPVIYTCHVHHPQGMDAGIMGWWWQDMCREGTEEAKIFPEIEPLPEEKLINKHRYSAFYNTDLETILRCLKIEDLVISGIMTNMCCESTARDAYFRDYRIKFLADATGTVSEEMHLASLLNLSYGFADVCTTGEIISTK